ncbi:FkbM family methyltransferase [Roseibium sp. Sym1]|uniref:FkbM family methyltransferase n=1 Tax=Roseibium sp. Sym1 TaxID=3016006 RepID=UPI0022B4E2C4|nr:FkbM family methyltransferase [Roseibium sp. Sym1]
MDQQGNRLDIIHKNRLPFYKTGIAPRVFGLLNDYMIDPDELQENDVVLDCGANVGEIGVGLRLAGKNVCYLAFEPGEEEHAACAVNNPDKACEKKALWNETTVLQFFEKSDSADSSLIEFGDYNSVTRVATTTVDEYCAANGIDRIKYLKIEAEGAEPEALEGAVNTLAQTHFVTVDCGYERGFDKESTLPKVCNLLIGNGFELIEVRKGRLIALFENKRN